jgi:hypothetical protein
MRGSSWAVYHLKGTPAKFVGIADDAEHHANRTAYRGDKRAALRAKRSCGPSINDKDPGLAQARGRSSFLHDQDPEPTYRSETAGQGKVKVEPDGLCSRSTKLVDK